MQPCNRKPLWTRSPIRHENQWHPIKNLLCRGPFAFNIGSHKEIHCFLFNSDCSNFPKFFRVASADQKKRQTSNKSKVSAGGIIMGANGDLLALGKGRHRAITPPSLFTRNLSSRSRTRELSRSSKELCLENEKNGGWWCLITSRAGSTDTPLFLEVRWLFGIRVDKVLWDAGSPSIPASFWKIMWPKSGKHLALTSFSYCSAHFSSFVRASTTSSSVRNWNCSQCVRRSQLCFTHLTWQC